MGQIEEVVNVVLELTSCCTAPHWGGPGADNGGTPSATGSCSGRCKRRMWKRERKKKKGEGHRGRSLPQLTALVLSQRRAGERFDSSKPSRGEPGRAELGSLREKVLIGEEDRRCLLVRKKKTTKNLDVCINVPPPRPD